MRKYRFLNILSLVVVLFGLGVCAALAVDTDGDRMPDDWELANGFDPNDPADAVNTHSGR